eukprot:jgi/Chrzof1/3614/Cz13g02120.t1
MAGKGAVTGIMLELRSWARYLLPSKYVAVYYPTAYHIADQMLKLANVTSKDVVYDLGCGDGRIVCRAAEKYGARGVGIELDPELAELAKDLVATQKLQHKVQIVQGDAAAADVSPATVVALYLSEHGNQALLKAVSSTLRPQTRIVSLYFPVLGWQQHLVKVDTTQNISIYLYSAP